MPHPTQQTMCPLKWAWTSISHHIITTTFIEKHCLENPQVNGHSFSAFANTISFNVSRYPTLSEVSFQSCMDQGLLLHHLKCTHFERKWWLIGLALNQLRLKSFVRVKFSQQFTYCIKVVDSKAYTKRKSSGDSRPSSAEPPEVLCNYHFVTAITSFHLLMLSGLVVKLKTIFVIFSSGLKGSLHHHDHHQN